MEPRLSRPSSTITAAALAGAGTTMIWALIDNFTAIEVSAVTVSSTTTFVSSVIGYFKRENVLQPEDLG